jgi:hypothetical protein
MIASASRGIDRALAEAYVEMRAGVADAQPSWEGVSLWKERFQQERLSGSRS